MKVNEIFYSIQGEGARAGEPSIFIRLAGCNLACGFCDTEFESGAEMSNDQILDHIQQWPCKTIVWTGGEPALQLITDTVRWFQVKNYYQCIETNGSHPAPKCLNFITVSPKVAEHVLKKNFPGGVTELRYVRHAGQMAVPETSLSADHYYLSPQFDGNRPNMENVRHCYNLCLANPKWKLSLQLHKLLGVL